MARLLDRVVVVDVESTCWEGAPPPGEENEIIEIGLCTLDLRSGAVQDREAMLVRPERSRVSPFCTELTTLTQEQVSAGIGFAEACARLAAHYRTQQRPWASYGDYDRRQFERQCAERGVPYPFGPTHLNVKNLFALVRGINREVGMSAALGMAGLELEGTHHRGVDDARNIARLLWHLVAAVRAR